MPPSGKGGCADIAMRAMNRFLVAAMCLGALLAAVGSASAGQTAYVPSDCQHEHYKPRKIVIACADFGYYLTGIRWSHWGTTSATGRGTAHVNDCKPFCFNGHFHAYPVTVRLTGRRECLTTQFSRIQVTFLAAVPSGFDRRSKEPLICPT